jgi:predicted TIM-barrel fold metal-dependent hydrolase
MANSFAVPAGACDCHMHFFGTAEQYPGAPNRAYTPYPRTEAQYWATMAPLGFSRVVVVQPSAYHTDNRCTMDVVAGDRSRYRGVAVVPLDIGHDELAALDNAGARAIRFNIVTTGLPAGATAQSVVEQAIRLVRPFGWHLQIFAAAEQIAAIAPAIRDADVPIVLDHMAGASIEKGIDDPGFQVALELLAAGHVWVKVSGADRVLGYDVAGHEGVKDATSFVPAAEFARALIAANSRNIVWGTDWPNLAHPVGGRGSVAPLATYRDLDADVLLGVLRQAVDDEAAWRAILVDNPARLYRF